MENIITKEQRKYSELGEKIFYLFENHSWKIRLIMIYYARMDIETQEKIKLTQDDCSQDSCVKCIV